MNVLLILTFALVCAASPPRTPDHGAIQLQDEDKPVVGIVNGRLAERHEFPYIVSIQQDGGFVCAGSILSPSWVLSTASCIPAPVPVPYPITVPMGVENPPPQYSLTVVGGLLNLGEDHPDMQSSDVVDIQIHPKCDFQDSYNIALVKLASPFSFNHAVQPLVLPQPKQEPSGKVWLSGWGASYDNEHNKLVASTALQYIDMIVGGDKECTEMFANAKDVSYKPTVGGSLFCALPIAKGDSTCYGDEGGPLVQNGTLVGIIKGNIRYCGVFAREFLPNTFVKVSLLVDFVKEHVTDLPA